MRRAILTPLAMAAVIAVLFSACGAPSGNLAMPQESASSTAAAAAPSMGEPSLRPPGIELAADMELPMEDMGIPMADEAAVQPARTEGGGAVATAAAPPVENRKLVKYSNLVLQTKAFDTAVAEITAMVEAAGGYIESQSIGGHNILPLDGREEYGNYAERSGEIQARIPADRLDEVVSSVGGLCNILTKDERMEDISESYFDAQARLKSLTLQEERLLEILSKAEKLEDVVALEQALSGVRYEIESLTASLRRMDSQVSYSYLSMSLREVVAYQPPNELPRSFGEELAVAGSRSIQQLSRTAKYILLNTIENGPYLLLNLLVGVIGWGILLLTIVRAAQAGLRLMGVNNRFTQKRVRSKKNAKRPPEKPDMPTASADAPAEPDSASNEKE